MSSMLRQHHVRIQDLVNYLRGYDPSKPQSAEDWSKQESAGFEPGMMIFCLERVSAPAGLAFGKKDAEGETYRVKDMCVVVGRDDGKSLVVNITASAFELRYLEVLMLEKARKAILDGKDFLYVAVRPTQPLTDAKYRELEKLGAEYAQGGSRRSLVVDPNGSQEPAVALLGALGVRLQMGGIGKQLLDIGSICHLLFAPEGRTEDTNKQMVKACFTALPSEPISKEAARDARKSQDRLPAEPRPTQPQAPAEQWGPPPGQAGWGQDAQSNPAMIPAAEPQPFGYGQGGSPPDSAWQQPQEAAAPPPPLYPDAVDAPGLNPFAPPPELPAFQQPPSQIGAPGDFAAQFKQDLETGHAGDAAMRYAEEEFAKEHETRWAKAEPRESSQDSYAQNFPPPPDFSFQQTQSPDSQTYSPEQFGDQHFQTPDFTKKNYAQTRLPAMQPPQPVPAPGADLVSAEEPFGKAAGGEDMFKPPYHPSEQSEDGHIPDELKQKLDPDNQLFQPPRSEEGENESISPSAQSESSPAVNFGFDSTSFGAFEKTSIASGTFSDELDPAMLAPKKEFSGISSSIPDSVPSQSSPDSQFSGSSSEAAPTGAPSVAVPPAALAEPAASGSGTSEVEPPAEPSGRAGTAADDAGAADLPGALESPQAGPAFPEIANPPTGFGAPPAEPSAPPSSKTIDDEKADAEPVGEVTQPMQPISLEAIRARAAATIAADNAAAAPPPVETGSSSTTESAKGKSLFERLNQQLSKGAVSLPDAMSEAAAEASPPKEEEAPAIKEAPFEEPVAAPKTELPESGSETPLATAPAQEEPSLFGLKQTQETLDWGEPAAGKAAPPQEAAPGSIKQLADSLTGLVDSGASNETLSSLVNSGTAPAAPIPDTTEPAAQPAAAEAPESLESAEENAASRQRLVEAEFTAVEEREIQPAAPLIEEPAAPTTAQETPPGAPPAPPPEVVKQKDEDRDREEEEEEEEEDDDSSPRRRAAALTAAAKSFQEPRLVMNEMATLMGKLEIQVAKAAKKLSSRSDEIRERLHSEVDRLVAEAAQIEKESQKAITNLSNRQSKQLDDVSEELRLKISDTSASGRYTIKQLSSTNQNSVDESKHNLYEALKDSCKDFRIDTEELARATDKELKKLVADRIDELNLAVKKITDTLDETNNNYSDKLQARFDRFKERMSDEANSVIRSLERNVRSMVEEIEGSWDRASDKLKSSKTDFEETIDYTVRAAELNLSHNTRKILTGSLMPKLKERKERLRSRTATLNKGFAEDSEKQVNNQILGLEASLNAARQQLQDLIADCMNSLDSVGRGQQAGLEEIFKECSTHAEKSTSDAAELVKTTESKITETEISCKKLAETSSIDNDPQLTEERNSSIARVQKLRQQANSELSAAIDNGCNKLEQLSQRVQTEMTNQRREQVDAVRDAADSGLTRIKDAIQEAFNAIEAAREKYME